jgi:hypothetical protein
MDKKITGLKQGNQNSANATYAIGMWTFWSFEYEHIWLKLFLHRVVRTKIGIYGFITIDASAGGLLVPEGIILPDFCWWIISPRGYQPPSSQCFDTDMVYL